MAYESEIKILRDKVKADFRSFLAFDSDYVL